MGVYEKIERTRILCIPYKCMKLEFEAFLVSVWN
jgi:hypothetical protein